MVDFTRREVVAGALDAVRSAGALERSLFVTGNVEALRLLRSLSDEARIGAHLGGGLGTSRRDCCASSGRSTGIPCSTW